MKHVINVAVEKIQLQTKSGDNNVCEFCGQPIDTFIVDGRQDRSNRIDTEDDNDHVISYHLPCFDWVLFGHVHDTTFKILYRLFVIPKLTQSTNVL